MLGKSNIGMVRSDNQDSYLIDTLDNGVAYAVVCDGMGGASGGKTASITAVNSFSECISKIDLDMAESELEGFFNNAVNNANNEIYEKSISTDLHGMGTTLVAAVIIGEKVYVINIGDSRCYLLRDDSLKRITKDHSAVQELVDRGFLTEKQAKNHPNKNIITKALGVEKDVECDIFTFDIFKNDILLLCSDGITNYIDDLEIPFEILKSPETAPHHLIELANSRGGADNSTVVIIKI